MSEDKIEHMGYTLKDEKTGKETHYEISYSQSLQKETNERLAQVSKELRSSNILKIILLILGIILIIIGCLLWFETGTVGYYLRRMVCPGM